MTISLKQKLANKKNSLLSTGPTTKAGKAVVATNAIKHGIFSKDIIICTKDYKENKKEYKELLENLISDFKPNGQMEHFLAEKIAIDIWRMKRVSRFETSSIQRSFYNVIDSYFSKNKKIEQLNSEIEKIKNQLDLNNKYIRYLEEGIVSFDNQIWRYKNFETDIEEDLCLVLEKIADETLNEDQLSRFNKGEIYFDEIRDILSKNGYSEEKISKILIECIKKENLNYNKSIDRLKKEKKETKIILKIILKNCCCPAEGDSDKIVRYEDFLQRSIMRNLSILKKLQSLS